MTLRITVLGCLLAAAGQAQTGTDGQPITMHNDPMTIYNGSIQFKFLQRTAIPQVNYSQLGFNPPQNYLLTHGHKGTHTLHVLKPVGSTGALTVTKELQIKDDDEVHIYLLGQPATGNGQIVIGRRSAPGAHNFIASHAHLDDEFVKLEKALQGPVITIPAGGRGPVALPGPAGTAINVTPTPVKEPVPANPAALKTRSDSAPKASAAPPPVNAAAVKPMTMADLISAHKRATAVADWVSVIRATQGSFEPMDKSGNKLTSWTAPPLNLPLPGINPAPNDDPYSVWARYSDSSARMAALKVKSGPAAAVTAEMSTPDECTAIHFCHMKDVADQHGNWTLQQDCGPVQYSCHGKTYSWTPPNTGVSTSTSTTQGHLEH